MALAPKLARTGLEAIGIWVLLLAAGLAAAIALPPFRDPANLANILRQSSVLGLLAIGQTFVIAAGMIDLSVGMIAGLVVVLACLILGGDPSLTLAVVPLMLVLGAAIGMVNGTLVNRLNLHPLILTFGMLSILQGVIFTITDRSVGQASPVLQALANDDIAGIPISAVLLLLLTVLAQTVFAHSRFGYHLVAAGGNAESARRAGVNVAAVRLFSFVISGAFAALAGLLLAGRLGTGYPLAGSGLELDSIVAVVLGGTALAGGRGSVVRSIGGVLALALISNVLNLLAVSAFVQMFIKGMIVVAAILLNQPRRVEA
ncbi:ABC transporter permease [Nordella sp. HKS 07]|uniref:ABC transporter permease n=1 Tax=Nordella sp. HKS 07 TaxID=2712222 RepID=UPI0013E1737C|nr:ABC transporter permease [Nordella sp. HKS 07]QIG51638.1 ABC transporter permease [Nordella sp. HKS 07]